MRLEDNSVFDLLLQILWGKKPVCKFVNFEESDLQSLFGHYQYNVYSVQVSGLVVGGVKGL